MNFKCVVFLLHLNQNLKSENTLSHPVMTKNNLLDPEKGFQKEVAIYW